MMPCLNLTWPLPRPLRDEPILRLSEPPRPAGSKEQVGQVTYLIQVANSYYGQRKTIRSCPRRVTGPKIPSCGGQSIGTAEVSILNTTPDTNPLPTAESRRDSSRLRVLVVNGHPRKGSLGEALAEAYMAGAAEAGADVRRLRIADMRFELNVLTPSPLDQYTEPSIEDAMTLVAWAKVN